MAKCGKCPHEESQHNKGLCNQCPCFGGFVRRTWQPLQKQKSLKTSGFGKRPGTKKVGLKDSLSRVNKAGNVRGGKMPSR